MNRDQFQLLHSLGYLYLRHGQNSRALALLMLAAKAAPDDPGLAKTMAYALLANGEAEEALKMVGRYEARTGDRSPQSPINIVKSRALRALGFEDEAKAVFRRFAGGEDALEKEGVRRMIGETHDGPVIDAPSKAIARGRRRDGEEASGAQRTAAAKARRALPAAKAKPPRAETSTIDLDPRAAKSIRSHSKRGGAAGERGRAGRGPSVAKAPKKR